jgi:hypothetical protein
MSKKKRGGSTTTARFAWTVFVIAIAVVGFGWAYVVLTPSNLKPRSQDERANAQNEQPKAPTTDVQVLKPRYVEDDLKFESETKAPPKSVDRKVYAVNSYLEGVAAVSSKARCKFCDVKDGLARLDFTTEFDQTYGSDDERTIVEGILTTMGQFEDVDTVQFLVNGQPLETLGNIDLTETQRVIRPTAQTVTPKAEKAEKGGTSKIASPPRG